MPTDARELLFTRDGVHARQAMNKARNHQTLVNDFAKEGSLRLCGGCKLGKKCLLLPPIRAPVIPPMALPPGLRPLACPTMSLLPVTPPKRLLRARCLLSPTLQWVACSCRDHIWRATLWWLKAHHFCLAALRLRRQKATRARRRCPWVGVFNLRDGHFCIDARPRGRGLSRPGSTPSRRCPLALAPLFQTNSCGHRVVSSLAAGGSALRSPERMAESS